MLKVFFFVFKIIFIFFRNNGANNWISQLFLTALIVLGLKNKLKSCLCHQYLSKTFLSSIHEYHSSHDRKKKPVKHPPRHYKPISEYATVFCRFLFAQKASRNHKGARSSSLMSLDLLNLPQYVEPGNIFVSFSPVFSVINQINSRNNVTGASMHRI